MKKSCFRLISFTVVKRGSTPNIPGLGKTPNFGREIAQVVEASRGDGFRSGKFFTPSVFNIYTPYPFDELRRFISIFLANFWFTPLQLPPFEFVLLVLIFLLPLIVYSEAFL